MRQRIAASRFPDFRLPPATLGYANALKQVAKKQHSPPPGIAVKKVTL